MLTPPMRAPSNGGLFLTLFQQLLLTESLCVSKFPKETFSLTEKGEAPPAQRPSAKTNCVTAIWNDNQTYCCALDISMRIIYNLSVKSIHYQKEETLCSLLRLLQ